MSLHTGYPVHGRQVARHPFCGPRLTEWGKLYDVEKSVGGYHGIIFIRSV